MSFPTLSGCLVLMGFNCIPQSRKSASINKTRNVNSFRLTNVSEELNEYIEHCLIVDVFIFAWKKRNTMFDAFLLISVLFRDRIWRIDSIRIPCLFVYRTFSFFNAIWIPVNEKA